jgi:hypothetical protein
LVASVGACFSYFGVPAYGYAKPVAGVAACATPRDAANDAKDSAVRTISVTNVRGRLTGAGSAALSSVLFTALHLASWALEDRAI